MTTYRTPDGQELEEYTKFPRQNTPCGIVWVPLKVSATHIKSYDLSQLREVKSLFDSGMVHDQPAEPQNFDSGLLYDQPQPFKPLIIALPADMIGQVGGGKGKNKRPTIPGVILADCAHVTVIKPVTLWTPAMRSAA